MLEILILAAFIWLSVKLLGLMFRLTWGVAKVTASLLMAVAVPMLVVCLIFVGGLALLAPLAVIAIAFGIVKACT